ncbi:non-ribosomal peptide synthetase [Streptomyces celluloflavus]|uniref:non-ribosomal peptide synthetase n=1 Tax=Streptomyces celluloflavus TaxID=58344 RepID=UPI0036C5B011
MTAPTGADRRPVDLLARFARAVRTAPDRPAVRAGGTELTFAELDRRTAGLAAALHAHGIGRGDRVGVQLPRTADLVVALLAVWRAGAAYVPLDPAYPPARLALMAEDAGIALLIGADGAAPPRPGVPVLGPDSVAAPRPAAEPDPRDPAYVIYTSGSTGVPKGVELTRGGVANLVAGLEERGIYRAGPSVVGWNASMSFDASVQQWARVCRGDTVVVIGDEQRADPAALAAVLDATGVTDLDLTPSHWELLRETLTGRPAVRLFMGGEPVPERTWRELADGGADAVNLYGPTECTVDATVAAITGPRPHLGDPLPGVRLRLLDDGLRPVPDGVTGELYLAGPRLAHGYLHRPGLTAACFVADPDGPAGGRMYRTGDRARRGADGLLEFAGRVDRQVKVLGHRIELGEIESVLARRPEVTAAAVIVREAAPGDLRIAAYVTGPAAAGGPAVLAALRAQLPAHLVPHTLTVLDGLPLTPNGKTDYAALPAPAAVAPAAAGSGAPQGDALQERVAQEWRTVLGVASVAQTDNFLSLGGHSLAALRVVHKLRRTLDIDLQLRHLLDADDLAGFTRAVRERTQAGPVGRPALVARDRTAR